MADQDQNQDELGIENVELEPLSDEALEDVAGGVVAPEEAIEGSSNCCSCHTCS